MSNSKSLPPSIPSLGSDGAAHGQLESFVVNAATPSSSSNLARVSTGSRQHSSAQPPSLGSDGAAHGRLESFVVNAAHPSSSSNLAHTSAQSQQHSSQGVPGLAPQPENTTAFEQLSDIDDTDAPQAREGVVVAEGLGDQEHWDQMSDIDDGAA